MTSYAILSPLEEGTMESSRVKELRAKAGMTQKAFAEFVGISKRTVENWEGGQRECQDYVYNLIEYKLIHEGIIKAED